MECASSYVVGWVAHRILVSAPVSLVWFLVLGFGDALEPSAAL